MLFRLPKKSNEKLNTQSTVLQQFFEKFCHFVLKHYCSIEHNEIQLPDGPYIICANHCSHLDTPVLMLALNKPFDQFNMLAAKDHFARDNNKPSLSERLLNLILVDRSANIHETRRLINECKNAASKGKKLIVYPEGTRSTSGYMQPFKHGSVYIAHKMQLPIIPVAIKGTYEAMPKGKSFIKPKTIKVLFGEPILPSKKLKRLDKQDLSQLSKRLEVEIADLLSTLNDGGIAHTSLG